MLRMERKYTHVGAALCSALLKSTQPQGNQASALGTRNFLSEHFHAPLTQILSFRPRIGSVSLGTALASSLLDGEACGSGHSARRSWPSRRAS